MEFLQEDDVAALLKETNGEVPLEHATNLVERVIETRRDAYITGAARATDGDFRAALFQGVIGSAYYRTEEDVYLAVGLTMAEDDAERSQIYDNYLNVDRGFKRLGREQTPEEHLFEVQRTLKSVKHAGIDDLVASGNAVYRAVGLARQALRDNQAAREEERSRNLAEAGEMYNPPTELLTRYEAIGKKVEDRFAAEHMGKPDYQHHELPASGIEGIFKLESGARAKFSWNVRPTFYRPESRLPGGSLTTKSGEYGTDEHTELFMFQRYLKNDKVKIAIKNHTYGANGEEERAVEEQLDPDKLNEIHTALEEIEVAVDDPKSQIDWHVYGSSYIW